LLIDNTESQTCPFLARTFGKNQCGEPTTTGRTLVRGATIRDADTFPAHPPTPRARLTEFGPLSAHGCFHLASAVHQEDKGHAPLSEGVSRASAPGRGAHFLLNPRWAPDDKQCVPFAEGGRALQTGRPNLAAPFCLGDEFTGAPLLQGAPFLFAPGRQGAMRKRTA
jgi:hypothetical protein